jgi:WD40 repeat protein
VDAARRGGVLLCLGGHGDYTTVALVGHTSRARAVQVSRGGQRVVSGSRDGTVRVWSVPPRAAVAAADVVSPRVVDLRAATPGRDIDEVLALPLAADSTTAFAGMVRGLIHVVDCDSVRVEASLRTDRTGGAAVLFGAGRIQFEINELCRRRSRAAVCGS